METIAGIIKDVVSSNDFKETLRATINKAFDDRQPAPDSEPAFFTRHDVRRILHISLPTVDKYTHAGILKGQKCGNRILYSKDSIQEALKGISEVKFKRV